MTEIKIIVPGEPVPQGRPRFARKGNFVQTYDPPKSKQYKKIVAFYANQVAPKQLLTGPVEIEFLIFKSTLKSFSRKKAEAAELRALRPTTKPDADNYAKGAMDALKKIIWEDDGQVVNVIAKKYYSANPRMEITVRPLEVQQEKLF